MAPDAEGALAEEPSAGHELPEPTEAFPREAPCGVVGPVIQLRAGDGARMRIRLPQNQSLDLPALVASFCGRHL